jgi:cation diffusion facilitator family transporter
VTPDRAPGHHDHDHDHDHEHDEHGHGRGHGTLGGALRDLFVPHTHDTADSLDEALEASADGIRAVRWSLGALGATATAQLVVFAASGSVALLADTIHNFSDALTAVPLWVAFVLSRRAPTRRYTYGYGRAEDLAGLFILAMIALSAALAGWESVQRLTHPQPLHHLPWVLAAGVIGFVGNEFVAVYRIRVGRRIGSAALVADGFHARADGFTSLAVVVGVVGVWAGFPQADAIVGLVITVAITVLLVGSARDLGRRLIDGVDPDLVDTAERALGSATGVESVHTVQLRWIGHRLHLRSIVRVDPTLTVRAAEKVTESAAAAARSAMPHVGRADVSSVGGPRPAPRPGVGRGAS